MRKLHQTRLHNPPLTRGNCYPTTIACFMDLESPEDAIQIQELYYKVEDWQSELLMWIDDKGWELGNLHSHQNDDSYYLVTGTSPRNPNVKHVCIYQNGKLWHDPHPDGTGILTEDSFQYMTKISKVCFKCNDMKPLSEYYKHKQMGDGLLGKCKSCTKSDSKKQTEINTSTPEGLEKERERHRNKYHRLGYKEVHKPDKETEYKNTKKHRDKYPEKYKAKNATASLKRLKGNHLHHWSYNQEHWKDCIEMDIENHAKLHRFLKYDLTSFFYRTTDGKILDTKEKHLEYIKFLGIEIHEYKN